jgi:benzoylformate decarboxylase
MTVREAVFEVMRRLGLTTIFGNPGSTEIPFLTDLPSDLSFILGLHEGSVVGMASGYALAREQPSFVNLHTAPGLGNAINAIGNARDTKAPLVVVVGQQDRRQLASEPFLTGRALDRLAGEYPVWSTVPARAQDVPGAIARAYHEAMAARGPALVVVPMDDWLEPADELAAAAPLTVARGNRASADELAAVVELLDAARSPAIVSGPGSDSRAGWDAVVALADRLGSPVWQEPFARRAGFPQDHPLFAGHLPWRRAAMQRTLAPHDLVLTIGTGAFRAYLFDEPVAVIAPGTRVAVITDDPAEAHRSRADVAVVAAVPAAVATLVELLGEVSGPGPARPEPMRRPEPLPPPGPREPLRAGHVFDALAQRLAPEAIVIEETPSSQPELYQRLAVRSPFGFLSTANGFLGFGLPAVIGLRMACPDRPVVGVIGDGSALYAIQALWSAVQYEVGALWIVMENRGYAVMDGLARAAGGTGPWPGFGPIDIAGIAQCLGCPSVRLEEHNELVAVFDDVLPDLADRRQPLLVAVAVAAGP